MKPEVVESVQQGVLHPIKENRDFSLDKLALLRLNRFGWLRYYPLGPCAADVSFVSRFTDQL